jgi:Hemerythrin HHE cation binding domain
MTGPAGQPPGAPDATRYVLIRDAVASRQADIIELILADHRRIGRLCHALYDTARYDDGPRPDWMLGHVWQRLADLLVAHTQAEEETCYLPLIGTGAQATEQMRDSIADHDDIRATISEAAGQPVGSAAWWHTVRTVMAVSAEHLEHEERDVLPVWLPGLSMSRRKELGRQWCAFVAAWRPDATFAQPPRRSSSGPRT